MLVTIDATMINDFIDDVDYFRKCADDFFHGLDTSSTGLLSRTDLQLFFAPWLSGRRACDVVFDTFDVDGNGYIDREEFRPMMMEIFIAFARGVGGTPVSVGVEEGSLLVRVYEHDLGRRSRGFEGGDESRGGWKKLLRKKSKKTLMRCGCSGRCFGGNLV